ncbi:MAG: alpha/beta hydrolase [Bacteroidota bacterium]
MNNFLLTLLKLFFQISSRITPSLSVRVAEKIFTTPFYSKRRAGEEKTLEKAERFSIPMDPKRSLSGYRWGNKSDPSILLIHGWTATATCFANFIEPLLINGYQVISYDSIAHGDTSGMSVSMTEWADTVSAVNNEVGKVHCIIGHSLGSGAIIIASSLNLNTDKIVLISPVTDIIEITNRFAGILSIPDEIIRKMHQYAWKKYYTSASKYGKNWYDIFKSDFKVPTLIVHDRNDNKIDISNALNLTKQWEWAEFFETKKLGHRRILSNKHVIKEVIKFIMRPNILLMNGND